jgi:hypothetical protein
MNKIYVGLHKISHWVLTFIGTAIAAAILHAAESSKQNNNRKGKSTCYLQTTNVADTFANNTIRSQIL